MAATETEIAAHLIERLLGDPGFRATFRRDPAAACREAGLDDLAEEMALGAGKAMMTLDVRESKSSLAGVMMAAAMEGIGVYEFGEHVIPHLTDVPSAVSDVLSRVNLPALPNLPDLPGKGALSAAPAEAPAPSGANGAEAATDAAGGGGGGGGAAAAAAAPAPAPAPVTLEDVPGKGGGAAEAADAAKEAKPSAAEAAADKIAAAESPEAKGAAAAKEAVEKIAEDQRDLPDPSEFPSGPSPLHAAEGVKEGAAAPDTPAPAPAAAAPVDPNAAAAPAVVEAAPAAGGGATADALLHNPNLVLDAGAQADIRGGVVDPRLMGLLGQLTEKHKLELSVIKTGHSQFTAGGSVSNHFSGRALDIARVDGQIVNSGSTAARELAGELAGMTGDLKPTEVGTPFPISAAGFFSDADHQDHLHVGFDGPPPAGFDANAASAAPAAAAASAAPAAPAAVADAAAEKPKTGTLSFQAVEAKASKARKGDSLTFEALKPKQQAAVAEPATAQPAGGGVDLSNVSDAYPGDSASQEQIAAWMAKGAEKRGLPPELPIMASLVESGMKNLNFGDADSVGFFQMRVGLWNQGEYAGYPDNPDLQLKWFLDHAEQVKEARIAAGKPIDDRNSFGEWIADVEQPASQFRDRYQFKLDQAEQLLKSQPQAAPAAVEPAGGSAAAPQVVEAAGGGGGNAADALLHNSNLVLDADAQKDIKDGVVDPRLVGLLGKLTEKHKIELSVIKTGHSQFTAGGSVSNHFSGRALDIARVDGQIVNSGSTAARELAGELAGMTGDLKPTEVGTPFPISAAGFFSDADHQDHLHVAFDGAPPAGFTPESPAAAAAAPAGAPAAPGAVADAAAAPKGKPTDTLSFQAVEAKAAKAPRKGDSLVFEAFNKPVQAAAAPPVPVGPAAAVAQAGAVPGAVSDAAAATAAGGSPLGASALQAAQGELGVHESGYNTGVDVDKFLASADVAPGNPWCASFVTWSLEQSGHKMPGTGWAAVQTWVHNAEQGANGLQVVSADQARPGDIVAYDWGGQDDFGSDGHIGFLASNVQAGKFTAIEGNYQDAVLRVPREIGAGGANMKFIRITGDAPTPPAGGGVAAAPGASVDPAAAATVDPAAAATADPAAAASAAPADAAAAAAGTPPAADPAADAARDAAAEAKRHESLVFQAVEAKQARKGSSRATVLFMKAVDPKLAKASAPAPEPAGSVDPGVAADITPTDYPGDNASQAELAKWLAGEAKKAGLPPELPVMASLVESGVKNLNFGDADSVGFFQMRVGLWNQGEYAGYPENPDLQAKWFIDHALAVKRQAIASGDVNFGNDPSKWGEWIANVEQPAEQFRGRYQLRLAEARSLLAR